MKKHDNQRQCWMSWRSLLCRLVIWFRFEGYFKGFPGIKYTYLACLKLIMWFIAAMYGLFVFMVYWAEVYSNSWQTPKMEPFPELVNNWKLLNFFSKNFILDVWLGSEYNSAEQKVNCLVRFCYILQISLSLQLCWKNEPHYWYISSNLFTSKEALLQSTPQFWNSMYIMKLMVYCSLFSAVVV